jgi:hypothetical protein
MGFQINSQDPPAGGHPRGTSAGVQYPEATGNNGLGEPVGAVGRPSLVLSWSHLNRTAWNWYAAFVGTAPSVELTHLRVFDAHKPGGAGWRDCTSAVMHRPTCRGNAAGGAMTNVEIVFSELVFSS